MSQKSILLLCLIVSIDLIYELYYQWRISYQKITALSNSLKVFKLISNDLFLNFKRSVHHNIHHRISHILNHLLLTGISFFFLFFCTLDNLLSNLQKKNIIPHIYIFKEFMKLSSLEIEILHIEGFIILFMECKDFFKRFLEHHVLSLTLFGIFLFIFFVPLFIRTKIFLEIKLRSVSPLFMAILTSFFMKLMSYFLIIFDNFIGINNSIEIFKNFNILRKFCAENNIFFKAYYYIRPVSVSPLYSCTFFNFTKLIISTDIKYFTNKEIESALIFEAFKCTKIGMLGNFVLPFISKILFALFMIYISNKWLKRFSNQYTTHVTAFLIAEEAFHFGLEKYIFMPITMIEIYIDNLNYKMIKDIGYGKYFINFLIKSAIKDHTECIRSSTIYSYINNEKNLIDKILRLI